MDARRTWSFFRFIITVFAMFGVWLVFTTSLELFTLLAGLIGSVIVAALTYNIFIARHQANLRFFVPHPVYLPLYLIMMVYFLYQSSIRMLGAVITGRVSPRIVHFRTSLHSDLARMVLASSITITPGTITLDLNDDHLTVHWFFCSTSHSKKAGEMVKGHIERWLKKVWV
jgi:multicomponent Na+:H+ antiporter subunit E